MSDLRIGLIGYGQWTRHALAPALRRDGRTRIVAAAAPSTASRGRIAQELGPEVRVFDGFEELLNGPDVDAVMIATPDRLHEETLTASLERGVAVFYEPPVSDRRDRIRPMLTRLMTAPQITHADLELGYTPVILTAAELARDGALGRIQTVSIRLQAPWGALPDSDLCLAHLLAPWYVDALNVLIGRNPLRVLVMDGFGRKGRRQNQCLVQFDYDGVWGVLHASVASVGRLEVHLEVNGDDGDLAVDLFEGELRLRTRAAPSWSARSIPPAMPVLEWPGEQESVTAFIDAVESGKPGRTAAAALARLHLVGLAAEASKDMGVWVDVEDIEVIVNPPALLA